MAAETRAGIKCFSLIGQTFQNPIPSNPSLIIVITISQATLWLCFVIAAGVDDVKIKENWEKERRRRGVQFPVQRFTRVANESKSREERERADFFQLLKLRH